MKKKLEGGWTGSMKYDEFIKLVKVMKSLWTKADFLPDKEAINVWYALLKDLPYEHASVAVQKYALTNKFAPSVADIREQIVSLSDSSTDWGDAWGEVLNAVSRYGYMNETDALNSMDELTRRCVKSLGWQNICQSERDEQMALRANFRMMYESAQASARETAKLPTELKVAIEAHKSQEAKQLEEKIGGMFNES